MRLLIYNSRYQEKTGKNTQHKFDFDAEIRKIMTRTIVNLKPGSLSFQMHFALVMA